MRALLCAAAALLLGGAAAFAGGLEVSTGFLIGPRYDPRSFYVRSSSGLPWQKSCSSAEFRKQAQGRLLGVALELQRTAIAPLASHGLQLVRLPLQSPAGTLFAPDGSLHQAASETLDALLGSAAAEGVAVELVLFDPHYDQDFHSPDAMLAAAANLTDWLIERDHRNVLLDPAADWSAPGWDFGHFVPQNLPRFATVIRQRFLASHTDYALPIVITSSNRLAENSPLVEEADVIMAHGEALSLDPRRVDRPVLVRESTAQGCAAALERYAGCLVVDASNPGGLYRRLAPLVLKSTLKLPNP